MLLPKYYVSTYDYDMNNIQRYKKVALRKIGKKTMDTSRMQAKEKNDIVFVTLTF